MLQRAEAFQMKGFIMLYPFCTFVLDCVFCSGGTADRTSRISSLPFLDRARNSEFPYLVEKLCESCAWVAHKTLQMNPWEQIKQQLETALNPDSYRNWVSRTTFGQLAGGVLRVSVPNVESKAWMETEYADQVGAIIRKLNLPVQAVMYETMSNMHEQDTPGQT